MKNILLAITAFLAFIGCSNGTEQRKSESTTIPAATQDTIPRTSQVVLPDSARAFILQYFAEDSLLHVTDKMAPMPGGTFYEAVLKSGTEIDFGKEGNWVEVNAEEPNKLPTGFFPDAIRTYIESNFSGIGVESIDKDKKGFELELTNGINLHFDEKGSFVRQEK